MMTITLIPKLEEAVAEQAQQKRVTPERLVSDSLTYLFLNSEPSEEEWYRVQAQLLLAQIGRMTEDTAQDDAAAEARRKEQEAHRAEWAAMSAETNRLLDQLSKPLKDNTEDNEAEDQELADLHLENARLRAEFERKLRWLFSGKI